MLTLGKRKGEVSLVAATQPSREPQLTIQVLVRGSMSPFSERGVQRVGPIDRLGGRRDAVQKAVTIQIDRSDR